MIPRVRQLGVAVLWGLVACDGDDGLLAPSRIDLEPATDGQVAPAGARLSEALAVVVSSADGRVVPRAEVSWSVVAGEGAELSDAVTLSDGVGRAVVTLRLGPATGVYRVRAALLADPEKAVTFAAQATAPPTVSAVVPAVFGSGDVVIVQGAMLGPSVDLAIGGVPAEIVNRSVTGLALSAVVPSCLLPGPASVEPLLEGERFPGVAGTYVADGEPLLLEVGQAALIAAAAVDGCATFPAAGPEGVEYLLVSQAATGTPGASGPFRLRGDEVVAGAATAEAVPIHASTADRFHAELREREREWARLPKPPPTGGPLRSIPYQLELGDRRNFRVCNKVSCRLRQDFSDVVGELKYVGDHVSVYLDLDATVGLEDAEFQSVGAIFDQELYEVATAAFGVESDIDANGRTMILMTPVVNALTPPEECDAEITAGFFFAADIDPAFHGDSRSNQAEVFYVLAPDPAGRAGCTQTRESVRRLLAFTFIHELQHMISYTQHVLVRGGDSEETWLNEAMSHLAEELGGLRLLAIGDRQRFAELTVPNLRKAYDYLRVPSSQFLVFGDGSGSLLERGAGWLFTRWLVDQVGVGVARRMSETALTGAANVEAATGEPFDRLVGYWMLANYVSDAPELAGAPIDPRLRYATWDFREQYEAFNQALPERFEVPFPIVPPVAIGGAFQLDGTLRAGSGAYLLVRQSPGQDGFAVRFTDPDGGALDPALDAQVNVIRLR